MNPNSLPTTLSTLKSLVETISDNPTTKKRKRENDQDVSSSPSNITSTLEDIKQKIETLEKAYSDSNSDLIVLNVGGTHFTVQREVLMKEDSFFSALVSDKFSGDLFGSFFIDRDPTYFRWILNYMRDGDVEMPQDEFVRKEILNEADYYGLQGFLSLYSGRNNVERALGQANIVMRNAENQARLLFVEDPQNLTDDPFFHLVNVYSNVERFEFDHSNSFPLVLDSMRELGTGCSIVPSLDSFQGNFNAFTDNVFQDFDWSNMFVAGGSALIPLLPLPPKINDAQKYYETYAGSRKSDIDVFLYGMTEDQAILKIRAIFAHVSSKNPHAFLVRTSRTISIISGYPTRNVQIILRLYKSPAEVLLGFDIDCVSVGYDGTSVYCLPRAVRALNCRYNIADPTRQTYRTNSYEYRLWKYSKRGFAVAVPGYQPKPMNFSIFSKPYTELSGFARILFLDLRENLPEEYHDLKNDPINRLENYEMGVLMDYDTNVSSVDILVTLEHQLRVIYYLGRPLHFYFTEEIDYIIQYDDMWDEYFENNWNIQIDEKLTFIGSLNEYIQSLPAVDEDWFKDI